MTTLGELLLTWTNYWGSLLLLVSGDKPMWDQGVPRQPHQYCLWTTPTDCSVGYSNICRIEYWSWAYKEFKIITLLKKILRRSPQLNMPFWHSHFNISFFPSFFNVISGLAHPVQCNDSADREKQKLNFVTTTTNLFYVLIYKCLVAFWSNVPPNPYARFLGFTFVLTSIMKRRQETDNAH